MRHIIKLIKSQKRTRTKYDLTLKLYTSARYHKYTCNNKLVSIQMLIKLNYHTSERYLYGTIRCRTAEDFVGGVIFKQLRQPQVVILITCNSFFDPV